MRSMISPCWDRVCFVIKQPVWHTVTLCASFIQRYVKGISGPRIQHEGAMIYTKIQVLIVCKQGAR